MARRPLRRRVSGKGAAEPSGDPLPAGRARDTGSGLTPLPRHSLKHRRLFEESLAGAVVVDADGRLLEANPAALAMLGARSPGDLDQCLFWALCVRPEQRESLLAHVATQGRIDQVELELRRLDGHTAHLFGNLVGVMGQDGRLAEIHGFLIDITEKKRVEAQLRQAQKMDAIGRLAGGVAHDFNNLLSVISGYGELLERELAPGHPGHRRLREIRRATDSATVLTRQLLTFSRHESPQARVLDLNEIVPNAEAMLRRLIGEDIELTTALAADLGRVRADAGQMEQLILNLAINARDAMPGGGKLMIETANVELDQRYAGTHPGVKPGPYVMLAVSDTGTGMDAETLAHLSEPFFTTKPRNQGTGLGLATVYGIAQQSGGSVNVYSEVGEGTSFKVYLPRVDEQPALSDLREEAPAPRGTETILLVEDSDSLREMVREVLEAAGYAVNEARTPAVAEAAVRRSGNAVDLLLTDVIMPGLAGPELAARLRASNPRARVLFMSGYTDEMIGTRAGGLDPELSFLPKPFTFETLLRKVREVLDGPGPQ